MVAQKGHSPPGLSFEGESSTFGGRVFCRCGAVTYHFGDANGAFVTPRIYRVYDLPTAVHFFASRPQKLCVYELIFRSDPLMQRQCVDTQRNSQPSP